MSNATIRALPSVIAREIDSILPTYPQEPYQRVFAIAEVKQQLIDYVFKRVLSQDSTERSCVGWVAPEPQKLGVQRDQVQLLVHMGLADVLRDNSNGFYRNDTRVTPLATYYPSNEAFYQLV